MPDPSAASFDDRAEPGQAKPAGGASEEAPHDGRASGAPPPLSAQGLPKSLGEATGPTGRGEAGGQKPSAAKPHTTTSYSEAKANELGVNVTRAEHPAAKVDHSAALRAYAEQLPVVLSVPNLREALRDAADEIERLREQRDSCKRWHDD